MEAQRFNLSLKPDDVSRAIPTVYARQYEKGREYIATIYDVDGNLYTFTDETIMLTGTKPSGKVFYADATASGNTITFVNDDNMTVAYGDARCDFEITKGGAVVGSLAFTMHIQKAGAQVEGIVDDANFDQIVADALVKIGALPTDYVSGAIASFTDGANNALVDDLTVSIVPKMAGSGTPSPSNVRAISGFTEATINRTGKNLIPYPYYHASRTINGITWTVNSDGTVTANGTASASANSEIYLVHETSTGLKFGAGTYSVSGCPSSGGSGNYGIFVYHLPPGGSNTSYGWDYGAGREFTVSASNETDTIGIRIRIWAGQAVNNLVFSPMIRVSGVGDDTYEVYTAETYEVPFGSAGTVYGGTLDATTGKLTVDRTAVPISSLSWSYDSTYTRFVSTSIASDTAKPSSNGQLLTGLKSSGYQEVAASSVSSTANSIGVQTNGSVLIKDTAYTTASSFVSACGDILILYPLATPIEVNLTPTEVRTLYGVNNIWSDTGDSAVTYRADTGLYIDKKIAEVQALALES